VETSLGLKDWPLRLLRLRFPSCTRRPSRLLCVPPVHPYNRPPPGKSCFGRGPSRTRPTFRAAQVGRIGPASENDSFWDTLFAISGKTESPGGRSGEQKARGRFHTSERRRRCAAISRLAAPERDVLIDARRPSEGRLEPLWGTACVFEALRHRRPTGLCFSAGAMAQTDAGVPSEPREHEDHLKGDKEEESRSLREDRKEAGRRRRGRFVRQQSETPRPYTGNDDGDPHSSRTRRPRRRSRKAAERRCPRPRTPTGSSVRPLCAQEGDGCGDYVQLKMIASKIVPGRLRSGTSPRRSQRGSARVLHPRLGHAGNGPSSVGSAEQPSSSAWRRRRSRVFPRPTNVTIKPRARRRRHPRRADQAIRGSRWDQRRLVGNTGVQRGGHCPDVGGRLQGAADGEHRPPTTTRPPFRPP